MKRNPCCRIYKSFLKEVRPNKLKELDKVEPQYSVEYVREVIAGCDNYCGNCGEALKTGLPEPGKSSKKKKSSSQNPPTLIVSTSCSCRGTVKNCPKCYGTGDMRKGEGPNAKEVISLG